MKDPQSNSITNNCQHPTHDSEEKLTLDWSEQKDRQDHPGHLSTMVTLVSDPLIRYSAATQQFALQVTESSHTRGHILPLLASFLPLWQRTRELFCYPCKVQGSFLLLDAARSFLPLQAGKYEGSATVFLNVILFPAPLCKLAVLPSLPSFLYTHSHVWRTVNHG